MHAATHITMILDSSGSMSSIKQDTIGGFNEFVKDQRVEEGDATLTLYEFNTHVEQRFQARDIEDAPTLDEETYTPGGQTALHDAIAEAVRAADERFAELDDDLEPETVIFVVLTDGKENASETPQETVREYVTTKTDEGWEFIFIGANQDAALTAEEIGVDKANSLTMSHSGEGTRQAYESTSRLVSTAREDGSTDGFSEEDRQQQRSLRKDE